MDVKDGIPDDESQEVDTRFPLEAGHRILMGIRVFAPLTRGHLRDLIKMQTTDKDWFIITYPKSGTTWMQEITWLLKTGGDTSKADTLPVYVRVPFIEMPLAQYDSKDPDMEGQVLYKSHLPYQLIPPSLMENNSRVIIIHRDPRDLAVSYYYFYQTNEFQGSWRRGWNEFFDMFLSGNCCFGDWFAWTKGWWAQRKRENVLQLTYEWMKENHREAIIKVANFLGQDPGKDLVDLIQERTTFDYMNKHPMSNYSTMKEVHTEWIPFIRRGTPGEWKELFTASQLERLTEKYEKELSGQESLKRFLKTGIMENDDY